MPKGSPGRLITYGDGARDGAAARPLLAAFAGIARAAAEAQSVQEGLARALDLICAALGWPIGHVYQRTPAMGQTLISAELWHLDQPAQFARFQELTRLTTFRPGEGLVGQVLAQQRPWLSPDVTRDRRFVRRRAARADGVHAWLAFPVFVDDQVVAVCECFATERVVLEPSLTGLLSAVGVALGRLYERERWRAEREALLQEIAAGQLRAGQEQRAALSALAAAIAHEINSPLFAARAGLALVAGEPADQPLIAAARADLARVAAVMDTLRPLAQEAPLGQRLDAFREQPVNDPGDPRVL